MENKNDKINKIKEDNIETIDSPIKIKATKKKNLFSALSDTFSKINILKQPSSHHFEQETLIDVTKESYDTAIEEKEKPKLIAAPVAPKKIRDKSHKKLKSYKNLPLFSQDELERFLKAKDHSLALRKYESTLNISFYSLVILTKEISVILQAGIPLTRILSLLSPHDGKNKKLKTMLGTIYKDLQTGKSLSSALRNFPKVFSPTYLGMIESGETAGTLPDTMQKLAFLLEREMNLRAKVQAALVYPIFVMIFSIITFFLLMIYILPVYFDFYRSLNVSLPVFTKMLMFIFELPKNPYFILSILFLFISRQLFTHYLLPQPYLKLIFDKIKFNIPIFRKIYIKVLVTNFCRSFGMMLASGVNHLTALEILMRSANNSYFKFIIHVMIDNLRYGFSITQIFKDAHLFPPFVTNMAQVGEETGDLDNLLLRVSAFYDQEIDYLLTNVTSVIEPFLLLGLGFIVGSIVIGLFLPLYGVFEFLR